jgi:hypothetical protein
MTVIAAPPVKPLDRAVVRHAVIAVVQHGDDDMLEDPDIERGAGLYDLEGHGLVLARGRDVSAGMVVEQDDRRGVG